MVASMEAGQERKRRIDMLEEDCKDRDVTLLQACKLAEDRKRWKKLVFGPPKRSTESQRPYLSK